MMVRTQIQLPDETYRKLKNLCQHREWTMTEAIRRAAEQLLETHPAVGQLDWAPPAARPLGAFLADPAEWRELANPADR